ncbi:hypothetical protein ACFY0Z_29325 [Streptomyces kronopolitis]|uniref:hypothetical protein n=1 Tax=Streptomyces kronopolitis TaxID=1612435 RepID=UPI00368E9645
MRSTTATTEVAQPGTASTPVIALPESYPLEGATLGRQPNNDGDNSGAMWFE